MINIGFVDVRHSDTPALKFSAFFGILARLAPDMAAPYATDLLAADPDFFHRLQLPQQPAGGPGPAPGDDPAGEAGDETGLEKGARDLRRMIDAALGRRYAFAPARDHPTGADASDEYGVWPVEGELGRIDALTGVLARHPKGGPGEPAHSTVTVLVDIVGGVRLTGSGEGDLEALSDALGQLWHHGFAGRFVLRDEPHGKDLAVFHEAAGLTA